MVSLLHFLVQCSWIIMSAWLLFSVLYQTKLKNKKQDCLYKYLFWPLANIIANYPGGLYLLLHEHEHHMVYYKYD